MGVRVDLSLPVTSPIENPITGAIDGTLRQFQGPVDAVGSLGGHVEHTLRQTSSALDSLKDPLESFAPDIGVKVGAINGSLGGVVSVAPPRAIGEVRGVVSNVQSTAAATTQAVNTVKGVFTDSKKATALALGLACLLVGGLIQAIMQKIMAEVLKIQRMVLAKLDQIKKQIVDAIKKALSALMESLPSGGQTIKKVLTELQSVLGKVSTMVAAVTNLMRSAANCLESLGSISNELNYSLGTGTFLGLAAMVGKSRFVIDFDFSQFERELNMGVDNRRTAIAKNKSFYHTSSYLDNEVQGNLNTALAEAKKARDKVNSLIEESKEHDKNNPNNKDDPSYREGLEDTKKKLEDLIEDLEDMANGKGPLEDTKKKLEDLVKDIEKIPNGSKDLEDARKELEDIVKDLEKVGNGGTLKDIKDTKKKLEDAKKDFDKIPSSGKDLEDAKKELEDLIEDLERVEHAVESGSGTGSTPSLKDELLDSIDEMDSLAQDTLDDLENDLNENMKDIKDSIDDLFDKLEDLGKEFDSPEVQEQIITACANTELRTVLDKE